MTTALAFSGIEDALAAFRGGAVDVGAYLRTVRRAAVEEADPVWISVLCEAHLDGFIDALRAMDPSAPLYGIPFAIKDNIDLAAVPTTAACPEYAYTPGRSAFAVQCLIDAGAVPIGKTNLDQFATGLVGVRSPYGAVPNAINPAYVSGGSSSGSSVAVAKGQVLFALGTDTAGSGRIPAAFNGLVGLKPTRGRISNTGVVPACRSLDCISIFAHTTDDAGRVFDVMGQYDPGDGFARSGPADTRGISSLYRLEDMTLGVWPQAALKFFGDDQMAAAYGAALEHLRTSAGRLVEVDAQPFIDAADMLYGGPWVAERYAAIEEFITAHPEALHPVTREITLGGARPTAAETFKALYRLADLKRAADSVLADVDLIVTPTAGAYYRIAEVEADPIALNTNLGYYTNFMNLLDLAAIAVPAGARADGLPFGVTFYGAAHGEARLLAASRDFMGSPRRDLATTPVAGWINVFVCGAHLQGLPLNHQLTSRGARLVSKTATAPHYRMYALAGGAPERPGLIRDQQQGAAIAGEVWAVPEEAFGSFVAGIPEPLGIGKVTLASGEAVPGFICEPCGVAGAEEITRYGGWQAWLASRSRG